MTEISIRKAGRADVPALHTALRQLSSDMGDKHRAGDADIAAAGFGAVAVFHALLAESPEGGVVGVAVYSPLFSTTRGMAGAYLSDLWVADVVRGGGLGVRLLAMVRDQARADWGAGFLRLAVYAANPRAVAFYRRLGFSTMVGDITMTLEGAALDQMGRE